MKPPATRYDEFIAPDEPRSGREGSNDTTAGSAPKLLSELRYDRNGRKN
jgi:hypothetical protein